MSPWAFLTLPLCLTRHHNSLHHKCEPWQLLPRRISMPILRHCFELWSWNLKWLRSVASCHFPSLLGPKRSGRIWRVNLCSKHFETGCNDPCFLAQSAYCWSLSAMQSLWSRGQNPQRNIWRSMALTLKSILLLQRTSTFCVCFVCLTKMLQLWFFNMEFWHPHGAGWWIHLRSRWGSYCGGWDMMFGWPTAVETLSVATTPSTIHPSTRSFGTTPLRRWDILMSAPTFGMYWPPHRRVIWPSWVGRKVRLKCSLLHKAQTETIWRAMWTCSWLCLRSLTSHTRPPCCFLWRNAFAWASSWERLIPMTCLVGLNYQLWPICCARWHLESFAKLPWMWFVVDLQWTIQMRSPIWQLISLREPVWKTLNTMSSSLIANTLDVLIMVKRATWSTMVSLKRPSTTPQSLRCPLPCSADLKTHWEIQKMWRGCWRIWTATSTLFSPRNMRTTRIWHGWWDSQMSGLLIWKYCWNSTIQFPPWFLSCLFEGSCSPPSADCRTSFHAKRKALLGLPAGPCLFAKKSGAEVTGWQGMKGFTWGEAGGGSVFCSLCFICRFICTVSERDPATCWGLLLRSSARCDETTGGGGRCTMIKLVYMLHI